MGIYGQYEQLLKDLGERIEIPDLGPDSDGFCNLTFEGDEMVRAIAIDMRLDEDTDHVILLSFIGTVNDENRERILTGLLQANTSWGATGGATIGLGENEKDVVICFKIHLSRLNAESFEELLVRFKETIQIWGNALMKSEEVEGGIGQIDAGIRPEMMA